MRRTTMRALFPLTIALVLVLAGTAFAKSSSWSGRWHVEGGPFSGGKTMVLAQKGSKVTGSFPWSIYSDKGFGAGFCYSGKGGTFKGTARGRKLVGKMTWPARGGHARAVATFRGTLSRNGRTFESRGKVTKGECAGFSVYVLLEGKRHG